MTTTPSDDGRPSRPGPGQITTGTTRAADRKTGFGPQAASATPSAEAAGAFFPVVVSSDYPRLTPQPTKKSGANSVRETAAGNSGNCYRSGERRPRTWLARYDVGHRSRVRTGLSPACPGRGMARVFRRRRGLHFGLTRFHGAGSDPRTQQADEGRLD